MGSISHDAPFFAIIRTKNPRTEVANMEKKKKLKPGDSVTLEPIKVKENPKVKKIEEADPQVIAEALRGLLQKDN